MTVAEEQFDPYHVWLGIPPNERPASFYRLLGVTAFERDPDVIASAADRQMAHLRTFQSGPRSQCSQQLLNEVAAAKVCLLSPDKKAAYDEQLRRQAVQVRTMASPSANRATAVVAVSRQGRRSTGKRSSPQKTLIATAVGCLVVAAVAIVWAKGRAEQLDAPRESAERAKQKPLRDQPVATPAVAQPLVVSTEHLEESLPPPADVPLTAVESIAQLTADSRPVYTPPGDEPAAAPSFDSLLAEPSAPKTHPSPPPADARLAVPSAAEQQRIAAELEGVYPIARAKSPAEKLVVAADLLSAAERATGNAAERYVLLRNAMSLARDAADVRTTFDALQRIAAGFAVDREREEQQVLVELAATVTQPDGIRVLWVASGPVVDRAIAAQQYEAASEMAVAVLRAAQKPHGKDVRKEAAQWRARVEQICEAERRAAAARATLQTTPDDPAAHLVLGLHYSVALDDWKRGLPHLAKGSDEVLRSLAVHETVSPPTTATERMNLADAWWDLAQGREGAERDAIQLHAGSWYQQALADTESSLARLKIDKRLEELIVVRQRHATSNSRRTSVGDPFWTH